MAVPPGAAPVLLAVLGIGCEAEPVGIQVDVSASGALLAGGAGPKICARLVRAHDEVVGAPSAQEALRGGGGVGRVRRRAGRRMGPSLLGSCPLLGRQGGLGPGRWVLHIEATTQGGTWTPPPGRHMDATTRAAHGRPSTRGGTVPTLRCSRMHCLPPARPPAHSATLNATTSLSAPRPSPINRRLARSAYPLSVCAALTLKATTLKSQPLYSFSTTWQASGNCCSRRGEGAMGASTPSGATRSMRSPIT